MKRIRVLLVDAHRDFLSAAANFLQLDPVIDVVGCMVSAKEAVEKIPVIRPDVVMIDLAMPEMSGLVATLHMKSMVHAPRVIMVTDRDEPIYQSVASAVQVDKFLSKRAFCAGAVPAIKMLAGVPVSPN